MTVTILQGDALDVLKTLDAESVQCVVTSPPYWGLRDYGLPPTIWGGDPECDHVWGDEQKPAGYRSNENRNTEGLASEAIQRRDQWQGSHFCQLCGAWRGQLGLEPTPDLCVEHLVDVFREVKRVLRDDGTLWLNLGSTYASTTSRKLRRFKPKDLIPIPWMVAMALQADGWWLRSDVIWHKRAPMPESVKDRCTRAHEYVFMLTKSARYFYDAEAVAEPLARPDEADRTTPARFGGALKWEEAQKQSRLHSGNEYLGTPNGTRNRRDVWTIATQPYSGAHYAVMPPALAEVCIKAGTSEQGCCPVCGAPWERVVEKTGERIRHHWAPGTDRKTEFAKGRHGETSTLVTGYSFEYETTGWRPTCDHDAGPVPCAVLDPFGGAGTTGLVADRLGRDAVLIELKADNCEMAEQRIKDDAGMWAEVVCE